MMLSYPGRAQLRSHLLKEESYEQFAYRDTNGFLTIGIGRNLDSVGLSMDEALFLLNSDINRAENALLKRCPWYAPLDDNRKVIVVDMTFNLGIDGFLAFKKMIQCIVDKDYVGASKEMLDSTWSKQVGERAIDLAKAMESGSF